MPKEPEDNKQDAPVETSQAKIEQAKGNKGVLIIVLVVVLALLGLAVYSYTTKKFFFTKSGVMDGVKYKTDGKQTTLSDKNGDLTVGDDVKLPKDFPKDIPVHPKGKIGLVTSKSADATWISLDVKDSLSNVREWYKADSVKKGWKIWSEEDTMITLTNDKYGASVTFTEDNGGILVNFSTMTIDAVKSITGVDPNSTTSEELQKSILNGSYQIPTTDSVPTE